jgi:hypothetical protein
MKYLKINIALLYLPILIWLATGCQDYFVPDLNESDPILVVDAMITNREEKAVVSLRRTVSYNSSTTYSPETGANVYIQRSSGETYTLSETSSGVYKSSEAITAEVGVEYKLYIVTSDQEEYSSEWQSLHEPSSVGEISITDTTISTIEYDDLGVPYVSTDNGLYFKITPEVPADNDVDYLYRWKVNFNYEVLSIDKANMLDYTYYCWEESSSDKVMLYNYYKKNALGELPEGDLMFFSDTFISPLPIDSSDFSGEVTWVGTTQFYLLLKQYTISAACYDFWKAIFDQSKATGKLFDPVETQVEGNIYCTSDTTKTAVGFFEAAGYSQKVIKVQNRTSVLNSYTIVDAMPDMTNADTCYVNEEPYFW